MKLRYIILLCILIICFAIFVIVFRENLSTFLEDFAFWTFPDDENRNGEALKLIVSIFGGTIIIFGIYAALVRAKASQKGVEVQSTSIDNQTRQIELSTNSQTNESFKNAIEHLGSEKESIVLGGIYELHFLARNNSDTHAEIVLNILASRLRSECHISRSLEDISNAITQTIINIIFSGLYDEYPKNITYSNLSRIKFPIQRIKETDFSFSKFPKKIDRVHFDDCNFSNAIFNAVDYYGSNFSSCNVKNLRILSSKLKRICIAGNYQSNGVIFIDSEFEDVQLYFNFDNSKFLACRFYICTFGSDQIHNVDFSCSSIERTDFGGAAIRNSIFTGSNIWSSTSIFSIENSDFKGVRNTSRERLYSFYEQLREPLYKIDIGGLDFDIKKAKISKNNLRLLTEEEKILLLSNYTDFKDSIS